MTGIKSKKPLGIPDLLFWHILYYFTLKEFSIGLFVPFNPVLSPCAPLFEEKWDV